VNTNSTDTASTGAPLQAKVLITLKNGVLDPQGKEIGHSLGALGFQGVGEVRQGKFIELVLSQTDPNAARAEVEDMCKRLLANTVIENYTIEIIA
jgi:phosphoribosylformylglycinamidine synthase subunit PurS